MNKRQIKKFIRNPLSWVSFEKWGILGDRMSYLTLPRQANNRHVQRFLRKIYGKGLWWYAVPKPITGIRIGGSNDH